MDTLESTRPEPGPQTPEPARRLSRRKRVLFAGGVQLAIAAAFFLVAERVTLRKGYLPWSPPTKGVIITPQTLGRADPVLGFRYAPGTYDAVFKGTHRARFTQGADGYRVTGPPAEGEEPPRPEVWVFGCSVTHGWGLNDAETFPWLLQEAFPAFRVRNLGIPGYGTVHSLLQFRELVATQPPPALAILVYADFHDERNAFNRSRRRAMRRSTLPDAFFPYARLRADGTLVFREGQARYRPWPGMQRSAFVHLLENMYTGLADGLRHSHQVSRAVVSALDTDCRRHDVPLLVAGIANAQPMLAYCRRQRIRNTNIAVDLTGPPYLNIYTGHPSPEANRLYADRLLTYLRVADLPSRAPDAS